MENRISPIPPAAVPRAPSHPARSAPHAELGRIVAGMKPGRQREDEIIVLDSSGTGLHDAAAAAAVYRRAAGQQQGVQFSFNA